MQTRAGTVAERIMNRLQTSKQPMSRADLNADPLVGGSVAAIKKTLQRLENRGVVEVEERPNPKGSPTKLYSALRAWGESVKGGRSTEIPCSDSNSRGDTEAGTSSCPLSSQKPDATKGDTPPPKSECPSSELSAGAGSDPEETVSLYPRAGEERSPEEMRALNNAAWNEFDL